MKTNHADFQGRDGDTHVVDKNCNPMVVAEVGESDAEGTVTKVKFHETQSKGLPGNGKFY